MATFFVAVGPCILLYLSEQLDETTVQIYWSSAYSTATQRVLKIEQVRVLPFPFPSRHMWGITELKNHRILESQNHRLYASYKTKGVSERLSECLSICFSFSE